ncbi:zeta toxin family protein [Pseudovibrio sp. Tun.PSC04-5.I4]|uniref:zeta toxin family protein n=1 Tax=Pseudovibrio sp. Tun.PSC04-5.I4 TaxID=1798213 RepID=UPI00088CA3E8|nr:zeta toxin family protein [Pseudovibrio sp. Tun.PSC04-5.I4]SDQ36402.1 MinD-like ATPase involved in chromosome partitioning or flagellar assembly [Pseudovibrio sp. Tun.PSC04-5.I4]
MKYVNFVMQGKGGAGKSFIAHCLAEYQRLKNRNLIAIDTDPVNPTFSSYKALNCTLIQMMENAEIDHRSFDKIIEGIISAEDEIHFVIDTGATTFLPLVKYLAENDVLILLGEHDCEVAIHTVVSGGGAIDATLSCIEKLFEVFPEQKIIIWKNEYSGRAEKNGKPFEELKLFKDNQARIYAVPTLAQRTGSSFNHDIQTMIERRLTFSEAIVNEGFGLMSRQRIKKVWADISSQLEAMAL